MNVIDIICTLVLSAAGGYIFFLLGYQSGFSKGINHHQKAVASYLPWTDEYKEIKG